MKSPFIESKLAVFLVAFALSVSFIGNLQGYRANQQRIDDIKALVKLGVQAHQIQCITKKALQKKYDKGVTFLLTHPNGLGDITPDLIRSDLKDQKETLDRLSLLKNCGK